MRKTTFVLPLFFLLALGLFHLPALAQDAIPDAVPSDPTAFMLFASQTNGLSQKGDQSWHLKVSFYIFDEHGTPKDQGFYEEFYVSPKKFKINFSSTTFSQTEFGTDQGRMRVGNSTSPYPLIWQIRGAFVTPTLPTTMQISRSDVTAEQRKIADSEYICFSLKPKPAPSDEQNPSDTGHSAHVLHILTPQLNGPYCFDAGSEILRISFLNQGTISIKSNNPAVFQGHSLPGDLEVVQDDKLVLSAHLESIEPVTPADESTFIPPPDATLLQPIKLVTTKENENSFWGAGAAFSAAGSGPASISPGVATGMLISRTAPAYPAVAKAARVQGTVVLEARISKQGHIESLRIISGPPLLQQAALDTVKDWTYRPYLLNGSPVEVLTTVNVIFTLGDTPAKPK